MAKIVLGARPKNFPKSVTVDLPEGGKGTVEFSFIYRTKTEFGKFIDELTANAGVKVESQTEEDVRFSLQKALETNVEGNADYLLKVADGWNLGVDFNRANIKQLCDELPGAAFAAIDAYRQAVSEGRLGN